MFDVLYEGFFIESFMWTLPGGGGIFWTVMRAVVTQILLYDIFCHSDEQIEDTFEEKQAIMTVYLTIW